MNLISILVELFTLVKNLFSKLNLLFSEKSYELKTKTETGGVE